MNKKITIPILIISLFAVMALALTTSTDVANMQLVVPTPNQNVSGNLAVNITAAHIPGTDGNITSATVSFWNGSNLASLVYSELLFETNDSRNTTYTTTVLTTFSLPDGSYNISINATNASDGANLENNSVFTDSTEFIMVDNTPNAITFNTPADRINYTNTDTSFLLNVTVSNSSLSATQTVIFQVHNSSNVFNRTASTDNVDSGRYNATFTMAELGFGNITLTVYANDTAGNMNDSEKIYVVYDATNPVVTMVNSSFTVADTTPPVNFNYTHGVFSNMNCTLYNNSDTAILNTASAKNATTTEISPANALADGVYEVFTSCLTGVGNQSNSSAINVTVDNTAPVSLDLYNLSNSSNVSDSTPTFIWEVNDTLSINHSCELLINNVVNQSFTNVTNGTPYSYTLTTALVQGEHNWSVACNDSVNNLKSSSNQSFTIDAVSPGITFNTPSDRVNYTNGATNFVINVSISNGSITDTQSVIFEISNGTGSNKFNRTASSTNATLFNATITLSELGFANHTITVYANDSAGNMNDSEKIYFVYDATNPVVTLITSSSSVNDSTPTLSFNYTHAAFSNVECILYNNTGLDNLSTITATNGSSTDITSGLTLAEGVNELFVSCTTAIGNQTNSSAINLTVDITVPTISSVAASSISETSAMITVTSAGSACKYDTSDKAYGAMANGPMAVAGTSHTLSLSGLSASTAYTIYARCKDAVNNIMTSSVLGSLTTSASGSGGGGSSGGSGGSTGASAGVVGGEKRVWNVLEIGEKALVPVSKDDIGVTKITFSLNKKTYGAWLKVVKKDSFPESVKTFVRKEFKKIEVVKGSAIKDNLLQDAKIDFKVDKIWLEDNKLSKDGVALFRFVEDSWVQMKTSIGQDDGTFIHYSSETPGFSYFVIGEREDSVPLPVVQAEQDEGESVDAPLETGEEAEEVEETNDQDTSSALPVVVVVLLLIVGVIVYFSLKHQ
jgi:PGF-pre-PGF domain-containing protein